MYCTQSVKILIKGRNTGPRSAVGNVFGYRCVSDCRSRGRAFDPGLVPYFRGDWSWNNFYGHSPPSADLFKKGCCQLQAKVCAQITGKPLAQACPGKSVVKWTDRPAMTIAVDMGRKANKQTNKQRPQHAASGLDMYCLPIKKDAWLIQVYVLRNIYFITLI